MISNSKITLLSLIVSAILSACTGCPQPISQTDSDYLKNNDEVLEEPFEQSNSYTNPLSSDDVHTVVINNVLHATKYLYINVNEGDEQYWIATIKQEVNIGETYYYKGGLLKTKFESKEFNRVFDRIFLVTNLVSANHGNSIDISNKNNPNTDQNKISKIDELNTKNVKFVKVGSIQIAELVKNPKKYEGKTIQITGRCVKVNSNIMNRNWIHIKDGSKDGFDLVITSNETVLEGAVITLKAVVTINKDFGAGYKYDLILENGTIIH